jgi:hypothetical protein
MAAERDLGTFIERFETDNSRRRKICAVAVPLGAIAALVGGLSIIVFGNPDTPGATMVPAVMCGSGLGAVLVGIYQGRLSFTRRDESFALYEGGLVYTCAGRSWPIAWEEIAKVANNGRDMAVHRLLGLDVSYHLKLVSPIDGRRSVGFTSVTDHAEHLGETIRWAVHEGVRPKPA